MCNSYYTILLRGRNGGFSFFLSCALLHTFILYWFAPKKNWTVHKVSILDGFDAFVLLCVFDFQYTSVCVCLASLYFCQITFKGIMHETFVILPRRGCFTAILSFENDATRKKVASLKKPKVVPFFNIRSPEGVHCSGLLYLPLVTKWGWWIDLSGWIRAGVCPSV